MKKIKEILLTMLIICFIFSNIYAQTNTSPTQTVCAGSIAEPYLINPPTSGSTYQWSLTGGGIVNLGVTTDNITIDWGFTPGLYTLSVTETDINGCEGLPVSVDVTVTPLPTATVANNETACIGSVIPDLTAIGSSVTWYSDLSLSSQVGSGNSFATGQTGVGLYTYYVTESLNGCEGPSIPVTLEIYNIPSSPTVLSEDVCFGALVPDLTATGSNIIWYDDLSLTNQVGTGNNFSTGQSLPGIYTYYATVLDNNGCESNSVMADLEIYSSPLPPFATDETVCEGGVIPDLTTLASNPTWYSDINLINIISSNTNLSTGLTNSGSYYVTDTDLNGCESPATSVTLTIDVFTAIPNTVNLSVCLGSPIPDLTVTGIGTNFNWYNDASLSNLVSTNNPFNTGQNTPGVYTYYVTETGLNGCESPSSISILEIYSAPTTGPINHW